MTSEVSFKSREYPWSAAEKLFRAVRPEILEKGNGKLSCAAFMDATQGGISVDRDGGRSMDDCINLKHRQNNFKDCYIASLSVGQALSQCRVCILPKPSSRGNNPWHCELYDSPQNKQKTDLEQCRLLAECAEIIAEPETAQEDPSRVSYRDCLRTITPLQ